MDNLQSLGEIRQNLLVLAAEVKNAMVMLQGISDNMEKLSHIEMNIANDMETMASALTSHIETPEDLKQGSGS